MILCHCHVVTDGDVSAALEEGAGTLAEVCRRTGAGRQCGTCVFSVRQAACEHRARQTAAPREETVRAAS